MPARLIKTMPVPLKNIFPEIVEVETPLNVWLAPENVVLADHVPPRIFKVKLLALKFGAVKYVPLM